MKELVFNFHFILLIYRVQFLKFFGEFLWAPRLSKVGYYSVKYTRPQEKSYPLQDWVEVIDRLILNFNVSIYD